MTPSWRSALGRARHLVTRAGNSVPFTFAFWHGHAEGLSDFRNGITMATDAPVQIPRQRISELIEREESQLNERT